MSRALADAVLFMVHDLTADPPLVDLDLVSCRNLLIHLDPKEQARILPLLHASLRPGGLLLLGPAEGVGAFDDLFEPVDRARRLFRRREVERKNLRHISPWLDRTVEERPPVTSGRERAEREGQEAQSEWLRAENGWLRQLNAVLQQRNDLLERQIQAAAGRNRLGPLFAEDQGP